MHLFAIYKKFLLTPLCGVWLPYLRSSSRGSDVVPVIYSSWGVTALDVPTMTGTTLAFTFHVLSSSSFRPWSLVVLFQIVRAAFSMSKCWVKSCFSVSVDVDLLSIHIPLIHFIYPLIIRAVVIAFHKFQIFLSHPGVVCFFSPHIIKMSWFPNIYCRPC